MTRKLLRARTAAALALAAATIAFATLSLTAQRAAGFWGWGGNCPMCAMMAAQRAGYPMYGYGGYPWWGYYGAMSYPNFYGPGPWMGWGINGRMMAGAGGAYIDKPNIYVTAPEGTHLKVQVKLSPESNWLAATPAHGSSGWDVTVKDGKLLSGDASYRYLYYDARTPVKALQDKRGACFGEGELIPALAQMLKRSGFAKDEIHDFVEYWSLKIPSSSRYCVYPQQSQELDPDITLQVEPKPSKVTRLVFMVVVNEALTDKGGKFTMAPTQTWSPETQRSIASEGGPELREWGVGFFDVSVANQGPEPR